MRLHLIGSKINLVRYADRVPYAPVALPRPLASLLNNIGSAIVMTGSHLLIPTPTAAPADQAERIDTQINVGLRTAFNAAVKLISSRLGIPSEVLSARPEGTPYWALVPLSAARAVNPTRDDALISVRSSFSEWTPADQFLASILLLNRAQDPILDVACFTGLNLHNMPHIRQMFYLET